MKQVLIIVSGDPASGKSVVSRAIADALEIGILAREDLKEILFDTLGWEDRAWSRKLGSASYELLWHSLDLLLGSGVSVVLDSNLRPESWLTIRQLLARHPCRVVELVCFAEPAVVMDRFRTRANSGERHPGHRDAESVAAFEARVASTAPSESVLLGSSYGVIDTSGDIAQTQQNAIAVWRRLLAKKDQRRRARQAGCYAQG